MTTDPPSSCETCPNSECEQSNAKYNPKEFGSVLIAGRREFVSKHGCFSHPLSRAWLNRDVIRELERFKDDNTIKAKEALPHSVSASNCYATSAMAYEKAIVLLKGGPKW